MILLLGSQKGGSGKSTLAVNIAVGLAKQGNDVVLVDADRQGTASRWAQDRSEVNQPLVHCVAQFDNIGPTLRDLAKRYDVVIVDAAGHDSRELRTGMTVADVLLTPFRPSQPDLDTLPHLSGVIVAARDFNPALVCKAVLTMAPSNPRVHESQEASDYLANYPDYAPCQTIIRDRKAYRDTIGEGLGVVEWKDEKAALEIQMLIDEVF